VAISRLRKQDLSIIIDQLKLEGKQNEIQTAIQSYKEQNPATPNDLAYLEGEDFNDYIHDMKLSQAYAKANREEIARAITEMMGFEELDRFDTVHNYIDTENMILRKGAVSAQDGERLIIPINMRDGSILAVGKGNAEWNFSAPHGAGRVLSRTKAMKTLNMEEFHQTMKGVWTTSVSEETLDEAPMAYKPIDEILEKIDETVEVVGLIKPVYNFKASDKFVPRGNRKKL
jgi:tRNA-splicing ligase RtcB (3'-phosphate/5'-hydroxy nucleic acid ligase)